MARRRHKGWEKEDREDYYQGWIKETRYSGDGDGAVLAVVWYAREHGGGFGVNAWTFYMTDPASMSVHRNIAMEISKEMAWEILATDPARWRIEDWYRIKSYLERGELPDTVHDGYRSYRSKRRCYCM
jgi:hypothetical protein